MNQYPQCLMSIAAGASVGDRGCGGDPAECIYIYTYIYIYICDCFSHLSPSAWDHLQIIHSIIYYLCWLCFYLKPTICLLHLIAVLQSSAVYCRQPQANLLWSIHFTLFEPSSNKFHAQELHGLKAAALNGQVQHGMLNFNLDRNW